jgi:hypothetical protein
VGSKGGDNRESGVAPGPSEWNEQGIWLLHLQNTYTLCLASGAMGTWENELG